MNGMHLLKLKCKDCKEWIKSDKKASNDFNAGAYITANEIFEYFGNNSWLYTKKTQDIIYTALVEADKSHRAKINEYRNFTDYDIIPLVKKLIESNMTKKKYLGDKNSRRTKNINKNVR